MKYFNTCENMAEAKRLHKILAKKYHPDLGGDEKILKEINAEFDTLTEASFKKTAKAEFEFAKKTYADLSDALKAKYDIIKTIAGIEIEIIGNWLWVSGDTKACKDILKSNGFRWSSKKTAWYFHEGAYQKKSYGKYSVNELRHMWGSSKVEESEKIEQAA